ncbi:hypothetical protein LV457_08130 [Mycobacterium sp. MYCO198283]|uniref:hypothetical protein n=1 Tax=Mycobacterium sp. MYCO198283 TaxID=2883505 RepID=UPI001E50D34E|nr:hypothetical protein [Mycobacterium sp. MYCO198283]MCG5432260.1 hypothetical protein [Mycobacterium sp. MYCO198283]
MRFVLTALLWLLATASLAVAVPAGWAERTVIRPDGYAALAEEAAADPSLREAMAAEISARVLDYAQAGGYDVQEPLVRGLATSYVAGPDFPHQFGQVNLFAHGWVFTDRARTDGVGRWQVDLGPMINSTDLRDALSRYGVDIPDDVSIPVAVSAPDALRPGQLRPLATWGPWVSIGSAALTALFALLTIAAARSRGRAVAALGVSALLVGAAGWAAIEVVRGDITNALDTTTGNVRAIAAVLVAQAEESAHFWLNVTMATGGALVVGGVVLSALGGARRERRAAVSR